MILFNIQMHKSPPSVGVFSAEIAVTIWPGHPGPLRYIGQAFEWSTLGRIVQEDDTSKLHGQYPLRNPDFGQKMSSSG